MKFCVTDTNNLAQRTKHAIKNYSDAEECASMILDGFFGSLRKSYERFGSEHCVACFDAPNSWRREIFPAYKTKEDKDLTEKELEREEAISMMLTDLSEFLGNYTNVTILEANSLEADDFIARWIQLHNDPAFEHIIISADGDFKQLVSRSGIEMYNPLHQILYTVGKVYFQDGRRPQKDQLTAQKHGETWKIKLDKKTGVPEAFDSEWELFYKIIRGDSSDTIPAAFPNVRETRMRVAFEDRGGPEWNKLINDKFKVKMGDKVKHIPVRPRFDRNTQLIDLSAQPADVIQKMDNLIEYQLNRKPRQMVGAYFAKFVSKHKLYRLQSQANSLTKLLAAPYPFKV